MVGHMVGPGAFGNGITSSCSRPHHRIRSEGYGNEAVGLERGVWTPLFTCLLPNAENARPSLLDKADTVEQVSDQRIPANATAAQVAQRQAPRQAARTHDLDAVGVDLDEDIRPVEEPVPMHHRISDRLTQRP